MRKLTIACVASLGAALVTGPAGAAPGGSTSEVYVSDVSIPWVLDVDLRTLPPAPAWQPGDPIEVVPERTWADFGVPPLPGWRDPVRQLAGNAEFSGSALLAFPAHPSGNSSPPDTVGAVGPDHYVSMVNASRFAIWDKTGGNVVPETLLNALWNGGSSPCQDGDGDPIVQYDHLAARWLMQEFDFSGNTFCVYVSQTSDPVAGGWFAYAFSSPAFPDYPQYGVWLDAYYVATYESPFLGIYAFDRDAMLAGAPATFQRFTVPQLNGSSPRVTRMLPADLDGFFGPPPGSTGVFLRTVHSTQDSSDPTTRLEIYEFDVDFTTPANSTFARTQTLIPAPFVLLPCSPGVRDCVPQPGTESRLDALFNRALRNLQYRNFGSHETLVVNQVVDAGGGVAGKRWWELRRMPGGDGGWSIHQEGTYSPDDDYRFMGSLAMNAAGDVALGYSVSSDTVVPEIRVTGRRDGDPPGTMTMNELVLVPGAGIFTSNQRWGDYTSMDVDPADGLTFWFVNQRLEANNQRSVWVGAFRFDSIFSDDFESGDASIWSSPVP